MSGKAATTTGQGPEGRVTQPKRPTFIVTASSQPTQAEMDANNAFMARCVAQQGFVRMRLEPRVYDPTKKAYVNLMGESINLNVFSVAATEEILSGIRNGLLGGEEEGGQEG